MTAKQANDDTGRQADKQDTARQARWTDKADRKEGRKPKAD